MELITQLSKQYKRKKWRRRKKKTQSVQCVRARIKFIWMQHLHFSVADSQTHNEKRKFQTFRFFSFASFSLFSSFSVSGAYTSWQCWFAHQIFRFFIYFCVCVCAAISFPKHVSLLITVTAFHLQAIFHSWWYFRAFYIGNVFLYNNIL